MAAPSSTSGGPRLGNIGGYRARAQPLAMEEARARAEATEPEANAQAEQEVAREELAEAIAREDANQRALEAAALIARAAETGRAAMQALERAVAEGPQRAARVGDPVGGHAPTVASVAGRGTAIGTGLGLAVGVGFGLLSIPLTWGASTPVVVGLMLSIGAGTVASTAQGASLGLRYDAAVAREAGAAMGSCSHVTSGSPNVKIEGRPAARALDDHNDHGAAAPPGSSAEAVARAAMQEGRGGLLRGRSYQRMAVAAVRASAPIDPAGAAPPRSGGRLAEGSSRVYVNNRPLARVTDRAECGGRVTSGAARTVIGGPRTSVPGVTIARPGGAAGGLLNADPDRAAAMLDQVSLVFGVLSMGAGTPAIGAAVSRQLGMATPSLLRSTALGAPTVAAGAAAGVAVNEVATPQLREWGRNAIGGEPGAIVGEAGGAILSVGAGALVGGAAQRGTLRTLGGGRGRASAPGEPEILSADDPRGRNARRLNPRPELEGPRAPAAAGEPARAPTAPGQSRRAWRAAHEQYAGQREPLQCLTCHPDLAPAPDPSPAAAPARHAATPPGPRALPSPLPRAPRPLVDPATLTPQQRALQQQRLQRLAELSRRSQDDPMGAARDAERLARDLGVDFEGAKEVNVMAGDVRRRAATLREGSPGLTEAMAIRRAAELQPLESEYSYAWQENRVRLPRDFEINGGPPNLSDPIHLELARVHARAAIEEVTHAVNYNTIPESYVALFPEAYEFARFMQTEAGRSWLESRGIGRLEIKDTELGRFERLLPHEIDIMELHERNGGYSEAEINRYIIRRAYRQWRQERRAASEQAPAASADGATSCPSCSGGAPSGAGVGAQAASGPM